MADVTEQQATRIAELLDQAEKLKERMEALEHSVKQLLAHPMGSLEAARALLELEELVNQKD